VSKNELKRRLAYSAFALVRSPLPLYQATSEVAAWVAAQGILSPHVVANVTALLEGFGATALSDLAELNEEERAALLAAVPRLKQKAFLERIASVPAVAAKVLRVLLPSSLPLSPFRLQKINTMRSCLNSPPPALCSQLVHVEASPAAAAAAVYHFATHTQPLSNSLFCARPTLLAHTCTTPHTYTCCH
jgi:hypothetical protein